MNFFSKLLGFSDTKEDIETVKEDFSAEQWSDKGLELLNSKEFKKSIIALDNAIALCNTDAKAYTRRGNAKASLGLYEDSLQDYENAIKIDSNYVYAYNGLTGSKYYLGYYEEALKISDKVLTIDSENATCYANRGVIKSALGSLEKAIKCYDKAIFFKHYNPSEVYFNRGNAKSKLGQKNQAIEDYTMAIKLSPKEILAFVQRGVVKKELGYHKESILDYDKAIELDSQCLIAYINRGVTKFLLHQYTSSLDDFNKSIQLNSNYTLAYIERGKVKIALQRNMEAIEDFDTAIEIDPQIAEAYINRSAANNNLGDIKGSLLDYNRFMLLSNRQEFFLSINTIYQLFKIHSTPFILWRKFKEYTNFEQLFLINPTVDEIRQQCRPMWYFLYFLKIKKVEKDNPTQYYLTEILINFYMFDPITSFRIYEEKIKGLELDTSLLGMYYCIESAKMFLEPYDSILELAIEKIEQNLPLMTANNDLKELYYAGQIFFKNNDLEKALEFFKIAEPYLPAAIMEVLVIQELGIHTDLVEHKKAEIRNRDLAEHGFLNGFPKQNLQLNHENYFNTFHNYAIYQELQEALVEIGGTEEFKHNEMWEAFNWTQENIEAIEKIERENELNIILNEIEKKINKKLDILLVKDGQEIQLELEHPKRYDDFDKLRNSANDGKNMQQIISNYIYHLNDDFDTYTLVIRYFFAVDTKLDARQAIMLQTYNIYMNRFHKHKTEAIEEAFVEGIQPVIGTIFGICLDDITAAVIAGGLSVIMKNVIKKRIPKEKITYSEFEKAFFNNFSYLKETTKEEDFNKYFGIFKDVDSV
jgi:tetratricopeptide (TPR) repeat protein